MKIDWLPRRRDRRRYDRLSLVEQAAERRAFNARQVAVAIDLERAGLCYFSAGKARTR